MKAHPAKAQSRASEDGKRRAYGKRLARVSCAM
jgi:hypothetical protein